MLSTKVDESSKTIRVYAEEVEFKRGVFKNIYYLRQGKERESQLVRSLSQEGIAEPFPETSPTKTPGSSGVAIAKNQKERTYVYVRRNADTPGRFFLFLSPLRSVAGRRSRGKNRPRARTSERKGLGALSGSGPEELTPLSISASSGIHFFQNRTRQCKGSVSSRLASDTQHDTLRQRSPVPCSRAGRPWATRG